MGAMQCVWYSYVLVIVLYIRHSFLFHETRLDGLGEENGGRAIVGIVGVDAVPGLEERVASDEGAEFGVANDGASAGVAALLEGQILISNDEGVAVQLEADLGLGRARIGVVTTRGSLGARDSSPQSVNDASGADNVGGTSVDGGNTGGARDNLAAVDGEAVERDIPVILANEGQEDGSAGELGGVTATDGDLRVVTGAFGAAAEVEGELLGGDLALGNGVLEEGVGLALGLAETETHDGVGGDVG